MIESVLKDDIVETTENAESHARLMQGINHFIEEGLIRVEFIDGVPHLYPANEG